MNGVRQPKWEADDELHGEVGVGGVARAFWGSRTTI